MLKAALFDLDGVVFDTEPQYTIFWGGECRRYHPEQPGLEFRMKGQTLPQILSGYFSECASEHDALVGRLDAYESQMAYEYVLGFVAFIEDLRRHGVRTALVTSSNLAKMSNVYRAHPEFKAFFDAILTSEDFRESKPSPDCYLKAAERLNAGMAECVVFEDSFNGLRSGQAANMYVVGLSTSNPVESISPLCNMVIADFSHFNYEKLSSLI